MQGISGMGRGSGDADNIDDRYEDISEVPTSEIILIPSKRGAGSSAIPLRWWDPFTVVSPVIHVCASSGYVENYLVSALDITRIKARCA